MLKVRVWWREQNQVICDKESNNSWLPKLDALLTTGAPWDPVHNYHKKRSETWQTWQSLIHTEHMFDFVPRMHNAQTASKNDLGAPCSCSTPQWTPCTWISELPSPPQQTNKAEELIHNSKTRRVLALILLKLRCSNRSFPLSWKKLCWGAWAAWYSDHFSTIFSPHFSKREESQPRQFNTLKILFSISWKI